MHLRYKDCNEEPNSLQRVSANPNRTRLVSLHVLFTVFVVHNMSVIMNHMCHNQQSHHQSLICHPLFSSGHTCTVHTYTRSSNRVLNEKFDQRLLILPLCLCQEQFGNVENSTPLPNCLRGVHFFLLFLCQRTCTSDFECNRVRGYE